MYYSVIQSLSIEEIAFKKAFDYCKKEEMKAILFLSLLSLLKLATAEIVKIECNGILKTSWEYVGELNVCYVDNAVVKAYNSVVDSQKIEPDVTAISFYPSSELSYFPYGLHKKFPGLKAIMLSNQPIKSLDKHNLMEFKDQLELLSITDGQITSLNKDIFHFNKKLRQINFSGNNLKFIQPGFFKNMMKIESLEKIELKECSCIDQEMFREDFKNPIWNHTCTDKSAFVKPVPVHQHGFDLL